MGKKPTGKKPTTTLVLNTDESCHGQALLGLFEGAVSLDCMVAFAKASGMAMVRKQGG